MNPEGDSLKMEIVMSFNVKNIKVVQSTDVPRIPDNLFKEDWAKYLSEEDVEKKRLQLKKWLTDNSIPIAESEKLLKLDDILSIEPPYGPENVMCDNEIVLNRIQDLVKSMPV